MWKHAFGFSIGIMVGAIIIYVAYKSYRKKDFKESELQETKLKDLITTQTYVELLTTKELISWFKENRGQFKGNIKMLIATPTAETLAGLGYAYNGEIDVETNILQAFYEDDLKVQKIRLVNYSNIDPNLQSHLIEENGLIVVTD